MNPTRQQYISKSTYLMGLQCQKLIWFRYNAKDQIPAYDEATQAIFDQGTEVGELARRLFPAAWWSRRNYQSRRSHRRNPKGDSSRRPLYEAAFVFHGGYAHTDILVPWPVVRGI